MQKKITLFLFLTFIFQLGFSQYKQLSPKAEISIITAGPGKVLYEGFGHSTIRIKDLDFDDAYNYGIFDFEAPNFYINFTKGKLLYKLQKYPFHYFVRSYNKDKRWIKEQVLNLNQEEKQRFYEYVENNAKPENASYYYDPFFNNCATKLREITDIVLSDKVKFKTDHLKDERSYRELMNQEIPWNTWGSFGINLALGSKLDAKATAKGFMYLPDYVFSGFNNAINNSTSEKLIKKERNLLKFDELKVSISIINPLVVFTLIMLFGFWITYKDVIRKRRSKWFDFTIFFLTGIIGILLSFLWFFTDHSTTPNNYNILWAFAPNIFIAFLLLKQQTQNWLRKYLQFIVLLLLITPIIWISKIQQLPLACIPFLLLLLVRYLYLIKKLLPSH